MRSNHENTKRHSMQIGYPVAVLLIAAVILCAALIFLPSGRQDSEKQRIDMKIEVFEDRPAEEFELLSSHVLPTESDPNLILYLQQALLEKQEEIDISSFNLIADEAGQRVLLASMSEVAYLDANLFYLDSSFSLYADGERITQVLPHYLYKGEELTEMEQFFEEKLAQILAPVGETWSDMEKALYVHDYLVDHFNYDQRIYDPNQAENAIHDGYHMLTEGVGVCQAYTALYSELLTRLGVGVSYVMNESINHIWNVVQIGDRYYHVDVTWDDPIGAMPGNVSHVFFLHSDDTWVNTNNGSGEISPHGNAWSSPVKDISGTYYDNWWGESVRSAFVKSGSRWYAIKGDILIETGASFVDYTNVYRFEPWHVFGSSNYYPDAAFTGLSGREGVLLFNTESKIYAYEPAIKVFTELLEYDEGDGYLYGSYLDGTVIRYYVNTSAEPTGGKMKELQVSTVWQNQYDYTLTEDRRILLGAYKGSESEIEVPATANLEGVLYRTVIDNTGGVSPWSAVSGKLTGLTLEKGVALSADSAGLFSGFSKLSKLNVLGLDVSAVTSFQRAFAQNPALKSLDLSGWNLSSLTNAKDMLAGDTALDLINVPSAFPAEAALPYENFRVYNPNLRMYSGAELQAVSSATAGKVLKRDNRPYMTDKLEPKETNYNGRSVQIEPLQTESTGNVTYVYMNSEHIPLGAAPKNAGTYYVYAVVEETIKYRGFVTEEVQLIIRPLDVYVTGNTYSKGYRQPDPVFTGTVEGVLPGEELSVQYIRDAGETLGDYPIRASLAKENANYVLHTKDGVLHILPMDLSTGVAQLNHTTFEYDGTAHCPEAQVRLGLTELVEGEDYELSYEDNVHVGTATMTVKGLNNYLGSFSKTFYVTKATVIIRPKDAKKLVGEADPVFEATFEGLIAGDEIPVVLTRVPGESIGAYKITVAQSTPGDDYRVQTETGLLVIYREGAIPLQDVSVEFPEQTRIYNGQAQKPTARLTYEGTLLAQGRDYELSYENNVNAGKAVLIVTGVNDYMGQLEFPFVIQKRQAQVTMSEYSKIYGQKDPAYASRVSGLLEGDTLSVAFEREPGENVGTYTVNLVVGENPNYEVSLTHGKLVISKAKLEIYTNDATKTYDGTPLTAEGGISGVVEGDSVTLKVTGSQTEVGASDNTYTLEWGEGTEAGNYQISDKIGKLTVTDVKESEPQETEPSGQTETESEKQTERATEKATAPTPAKQTETGEEKQTNDLVEVVSGCFGRLPASALGLCLLVGLGGAVLIGRRKGRRDR